MVICYGGYMNECAIGFQRGKGGYLVSSWWHNKLFYCVDNCAEFDVNGSRTDWCFSVE